jgi:hypothetical protein
VQYTLLTSMELDWGYLMSHRLAICARKQPVSICASLFAVLFFGPVEAQDAPLAKSPSWLLPVPELEADPKIPTLARVLSYAWAQEISAHADIERYVHALAAAAPDRCRLVRYGQSYQGKSLYYLIITSADNLKNIEAIRKQSLALADPRLTSADKAAEVAAQAPAVVWLAYCVHGNETSPSDAALLTAYHLLADQRPKTRELLEKLVVVIDPLQNPDGRDRFVQYYRDRRGAYDQESPLAVDRLENWPGGRFNHYLFDMNRDWHLQTQQESAARVAAFLHWKPQIFVDAHEMGADSNFFFDPSADPYNPLTLPRQREWHVKIGRQQADEFDRHGFAYTTREVYDAFGPQYGSTWPFLHGSIGILWEQAGVRGRVVKRRDETKLHYHDGVRHHYISGLSTLSTAAKDRRQLLLDFYRNAADSVKLGEGGPVRAFFLLEGKRPARAAALARLLAKNGIEVRRVSEERVAATADIVSGKAGEQSIPAGSYYVPLNQPAARLALTLLERHQEMGAEYIKRQEDRVKRGLADQFYDATAWSLPLAYDVSCLTASSPLQIASAPLETGPTPGKIIGADKPARVGYLVAGEDDNVLPALCQWLGQKLRVHVLSEPTRVGGVAFGRGSLFLRVADNPESLHEKVVATAKAHGVVVHAADSAFVDAGAGLGGPHVHWIKPPRVLLLVDRPASYSVGHTWYLFDEVWRYPVTRVAGRSLPQVDWSQFDVCILPQGTYTGAEAPPEDVVRRLKDWVQTGGTLVLVGGAAPWAAGEKVKLLPTKLEQRKSEEDKAAATPTKKDEEKSADQRPPWRVPGVFLKAKIDDDHFVTWGANREGPLFFSGDRIFAPLKEGDGKNLVAFGERKGLLVSGYCWPQTLDMLPGKPYVLYRSLGKGHVIAFADDPNHRAASPPLERLFFNAVFFGPAR